MSTESEARAAIAELDNYNLNGSRIHVEVGIMNGFISYQNCLP